MAISEVKTSGQIYIRLEDECILDYVTKSLTPNCLYPSLLQIKKKEAQQKRAPLKGGDQTKINAS